MRRFLAALVALLVCSSAQAQLQARDLNGDKVADAFYDAAQNITWLSATSGPATWVDQTAWAAGLDDGGVTGWRLPRVFLEQDLGYPVPVQSELTRLIASGGVASFGNVSGFFWTDSYMLAGQYFAQRVNVATGASSPTDELSYQFQLLSGWAVHDGAVGAAIPPVPEPSTYALMLSGLGTLALLVRRRGRPGRVG